MIREVSVWFIILWFTIDEWSAHVKNSVGKPTYFSLFWLHLIHVKSFVIKFEAKTFTLTTFNPSWIRIPIYVGIHAPNTIFISQSKTNSRSLILAFLIKAFAFFVSLAPFIQQLSFIALKMFEHLSTLLYINYFWAVKGPLRRLASIVIHEHLRNIFLIKFRVN